MGYHENKACIEACLKAAALCNHCASSCLQEDNVDKMVRCIQLDMECATLCYAAAQLMSMGSKQAKELCGMCADACNVCAEECEKMDTQHCRECADACRKCAEECTKMAA